MMNKHIIVLALTLAVGLPAHADKKVAKQAFIEGKTLFEEGEYSDAAVQFRIAYEEEPTWKLLYNIGQCEAGARNYGLALEAFEQYIVEAGDEIDDFRRQEVQKEIARLRPLVGLLKIEGPNGATVQVNGVSRGTLPLSGLIPISAAREFEISGQLDGAALATETVKLMTGQTYTVILSEVSSKSSKLAPPLEKSEEEAGSETTVVIEDTSQPARKPVSEPPASDLKKAGVFLTVTGTVVLVGGFTMGTIAFFTAKKLQEVNPNGVAGDALVQRDQLKTVALVGDILMGAGAVVGLTGVILLLVNKKRIRESLNASSKSIWVKPMVGQSNGLMLEGRF